MATEMGGGGGGNLSEMYGSARKVLLRAKAGIDRLERLEFSSASLDSPELSFSLKNDISILHSLCADMDRISRSVAAKAQRDLWRRKVEQIAEEADALGRSLDTHSHRAQRRIVEAQERADLFRRSNGEASHVMRIFDEEAQATQSVRNSSRMLEEATSTGEAILHKYSEQRERLKRAQRKALDVLNTVGLSNSVLKMIERRSRTDKWIKYAGMILTVVIVFFFWKWTR